MKLISEDSILEPEKILIKLTILSEKAPLPSKRQLTVYADPVYDDFISKTYEYTLLPMEDKLIEIEITGKSKVKPETLEEYGLEYIPGAYVKITERSLMPPAPFVSKIERTYGKYDRAKKMLNEYERLVKKAKEKEKPKEEEEKEYEKEKEKETLLKEEEKKKTFIF